MVPRHYFSLDEVFDDDPDGLLNVRAKNTGTRSGNQTVQGFEAINEFVDAHQRTPSEEGDFDEKRYARRLKAIRQDPEKRQALAPYDRHQLLAAPDEPASQSNNEVEGAAGSGQGAVSASDNVTSLEDIFADDGGLLDSQSPEIFESRHVSFDPSYYKKNLPDEIAQRVRCEDFWRFQPLFDDVHQQIRDRAATATRFKRASQVREGDFFALDGVLCLVDNIGEVDEGKGDEHNPRIRAVFDNGTEANLLLHSFARALYKDPHGKRIHLPDRALDQMAGISHHDRRHGVLYILRSLRQDPEIAKAENPIKIGYTEHSVKERLSGADRSPTYLEGPVEVVAEYDCYNLDPRKVERLIHEILEPLRLNITLTSSEGKKYRPREWFRVSVDTAEELVNRMIDGSITQYRLDRVNGRLVPKTNRYADTDRS